MKFGITADLHFSAYSQDAQVGDYPERLNSLKTTLDNMVENCASRGIHTIVLAGDLLHNKSIIYTTAQDLLLKFFRKHPNTKFFVIDGNHDLSSKGTDSVSALRSLEKESNVDWISYQSKGNSVVHYEAGNIAFIPFFPGMDEYVKKTKANILISHFGLDEGMLSSGISVQSSIKGKHLKNYKLVLLGHYHLPQAMLYGSTHIYYMGSPIQLDWGEKNEVKRFLIVDSETREVESVPTTGYKKYLQFDLSEENKVKLLEEAKTLRDEGHHIKLVTTEKLEFDEDMKSINVVENIEEDITNRGITSDMGEKEKILKYEEIKGIPEEERDAYLKTAMRLIDNTELPE